MCLPKYLKGNVSDKGSLQFSSKCFPKKKKKLFGTHSKDAKTFFLRQAENTEQSWPCLYLAGWFSVSNVPLGCATGITLDLHVDRVPNDLELLHLHISALHNVCLLLHCHDPRALSSPPTNLHSVLLQAGKLASETLKKTTSRDEWWVRCAALCLDSTFRFTRLLEYEVSCSF